MNDFTFSMPEFLQRYYAPPKPQMRNWLEGAGVALPDAPRDGTPHLGAEAQAGQLQDLTDKFRGNMPPWMQPGNPGARWESGPAYNPKKPGMFLEGFEGSPPNLDAGELAGQFQGPASGRPWMPESAPPNRDADGVFPAMSKPWRVPEPVGSGPFPNKPMPRSEPNSNRLPGWNAVVPEKPTGTPTNTTAVPMGPVTSMAPRMGGEPVRPRIPPKFGGPRFASGGRVDMPDYLMGAGGGKGLPVGDSGSSTGAAFSAPPSKMAPLSAVAPGGGELNIQTASPVVPAAPQVDPGNPEEAPQEIILPKLGRSRRSLTPSIRGYTPGGSTFGVAKLRTTRNIMPRFASGGRIPSLASPTQMMIEEGVAGPMFNMFSGEDPMGDEMSEMDADGYQSGGAVKGYAAGGRVKKTLRDIAAEKKWEVDWDRLNHSGDDSEVAYRKQFFDMVGQEFNPYGTGGATMLDPMGRAGEVDVSMIPDNLRGTEWQAIADRLGAVDAPTLRGMLARGRGAELFQGDRGMYNEYVADLGNMVYDDQLGWIPGEGGWQEGSRVGRSFRNMQTWGPAAVLGAGMLSNVMQTGSMLGGGTGAGGGAGVGGGGGGAASIAPPPLEGAGALTTGGGGTSAASAAAAEALPGLTQSGLTVSSGASIPGMSYGMGGVAGLGGSNVPSIDPYEVDMAAGSVSTNNPGAWEQATNWVRQNTGMDITKAGEWLANNPGQAARIVASIAGGIGAGGIGAGGSGTGDVNLPEYVPGTGGPATSGPAPEIKPWQEPVNNGARFASGDGGTINISTASDGYYEQAYRPLEGEILKAARERMDPSYRESKALEATADVANAFQAQRGALARDASRRGLRAPTSRDMIGLAASEGAARALAANKARRDMEESAISQGAGLVSSGQRYLDRASQQAAAAASAAGAARAAGISADAQRESARDNRAFQSYMQDRSDAARRYEFDTNAGLERERINRGIYTSDRDYQQRQSASDDARRQRNLQGIGTIISGIGSIFGKGFESGGRVIDGDSERVPDADEGGRVKGPGTETSDSIPARLSKDEMVLNTDAVKAIDEMSPGLLDRINDIGLVKRALKMGVVAGDRRPLPTSKARTPVISIGVRG